MKTIRNLMRLLGYDGTKRKRYDQMEASTLAWNSLFPLIKKLFENEEKLKKNLRIIQIGANDIKRHDPFSFIHKKNKTHNFYYIEPNPFCVSKLRKQFKKNKKVKIIECAIDDKNGKQEFFFFTRFNYLIRQKILLINI